MGITCVVSSVRCSDCISWRHDAEDDIRLGDERFVVIEGFYLCGFDPVESVLA